MNSSSIAAHCVLVLGSHHQATRTAKVVQELCGEDHTPTQGGVEAISSQLELASRLSVTMNHETEWMELLSPVPPGLAVLLLCSYSDWKCSIANRWQENTYSKNIGDD